MKATENFLGFDIGASNGKAIVGKFDGETLKQEEIYRFPNQPVALSGHLHWDVLSLVAEIKKGLASYSQKYGRGLAGVGIDTWGVDFGLLDSQGKLIGNPYHYRDRKNVGMSEKINRLLGGYEIYRTTGMKVSDIETICQLHALAEQSSPQLKIAKNFLMMPSLLSYFLGGEKVQEHSIITTTCLYDITRDKPAEGFFRKLGIPKGIIGKVVKPGTYIGAIDSVIAEEAGLNNVPLIAPAMHDTASAVIAIPAEKTSQWAFLSSGTWSVTGIETAQPVNSKEGYLRNIVTAATAEGKYMVRSNTTGLWLLQECKRVWEQSGESVTYPELVNLAEKAQSFSAFIDVDDAGFAGFADMPSAIITYCARTGQHIPQDKGTMVRVILESMALKHKTIIRKIQHLTGNRYEVIHLVGGGAKNRLLCQFTADATGIPVIAGPSEGTGLGNIIMQMKASGAIGSVAEGRMILRKSITVDEYKPEETAAWRDAYELYQKITGGKDD